MHNFLDTHHLTNVKKDQLSNLNIIYRYVTPTETEVVLESVIIREVYSYSRCEQI